MYRSPVANPILAYGTTRRFLGLGNPRGPYPLPGCRAMMYGGLGDPKAWMPWPNVRAQLYGGLGNPDAFYRRYAKGMGDVFGPPMSVTGDLPLTGPYTNPSSPLVGVQLAAAASSQNPDLSAVGSSSFTDWINANSSTVLWIGGVGVGVLLLSRLAK